ncbi:MAG: type II methionyl aminopeptidase [Candidatus Thorarchaeota archaeon]
MTDGPHPSQVKAGNIAAKVMKEVEKEVTPKTKVFTLCTLVEKKIIEYGARPAFPCNVSVNNIAAHYTSPIGDTSILPESGLVKIDLGVQIDGYIADMARTFDMDGSFEAFVVATDDALQEAIAMMRPGTKLGDVGKTIEKVIGLYGLRPISNLTGHNIERWRLHAGKQVPNVKTRVSDIIEAGEVYAIEPFATNGAGTVIETDLMYIFANTGRDEPLEGTTEKLRVHLRKKHGPLPFAARWITTKSEDIDLVEEIRTLLKFKAIRAYPVQVSKKGRHVSQSEHTIYVSENGPVVLTKMD